MRRIAKNEYEQAARLVVQAFRDDPLTRYTMVGVEDAYELLQKEALEKIAFYALNGDVFLLERPGVLGALIGADGRKLGLRKEFFSMQRLERARIKSLDAQQKRTLKENNARVKALKSYSAKTWYRNYVGRDFYHIGALALDASVRGSGAMRALLSPLLEDMAEQGLPVVLETYNLDCVVRFEHFGFQVVQILESDRSQIRQYCMIKGA